MTLPPSCLSIASEAKDFRFRQWFFLKELPASWRWFCRLEVCKSRSKAIYRRQKSNLELGMAHQIVSDEASIYCSFDGICLEHGFGQFCWHGVRNRG